ncbi:LytR C-terminal domain-containing protein [Agromyces atrinae]|uniref:LytR family transcriptional regulator n=1 Tax=Agromyces atrinae TaxID=592376 RepID=A0A4Q2M7S3_9MICO|nr:LytR C-terminal domain-containing protein [Agromyces atrinae]NYD68626.1 hypothetical protein [Agromyces atrinae]RXZ86001.1 LytR family transcriptional regulator [Agromyces atrinae]
MTPTGKLSHVMAQKFPSDRFDQAPSDIERVGAHRAPLQPGRRWVTFGWAALATVVLVVAGIVTISLYNNELLRILPGSSAEETPSDEPVQTAEPTLDPATPVMVLNGTSTSGLAATAAEALTAAGLTIDVTANADEDTVQSTVVVYATPELEGAARGIAQSLGTTEVREGTEFAEAGASLVVVLGADYAALVAG